MPDSLIEIIERGKTIASVDRVDYPESGASYLRRLEENHFWFVVRRHLVYDLLKRFTQSECVTGLDLGCGTGFTAVWLSEAGIKTYGIDAKPSFSPYQCSGRGAGFLAGDIFSVEPREEFDFVLLLDVLEHIRDDATFLGHALKSLRPGGVGIITVPAFRWLWSRTDELSHHYRRYNLAELQSVVDKAIPQAQTLYHTYFYLSTLPLFLVSRIMTRFRPAKTFENQDEANPSEMLNKALKGMLDLERRVARSVSLPFGSSLIYVLRK
jgi:SAM-dependent methyltransferase